MENELNKKIPEKYIMLALCCMLVCATTGMTNVAGLFYTPVCNDLGILRGTFNLQNVIGTCIGTVVHIFVPRILKKYPIKSLIRVSVIVVSITYILNSFNNTVYGFYITYGIKSMVGTFYSSLVTFMIINSWFKENNGTASSIMMCFSGVAGAIFSPIFSSVISNFGWRNGYRAMGILMFVLCIPVMFYPKSLINADSADSGPSKSKTGANDGPKEEKKKNLTSYIILIVFLISNFLVGSFASHVSGFIESKGFSSETGALVLSCAMIGNIVFKLINGYLSDKIGVRLTDTVMMLLPAVAFTLFLTASSPTAMYIAGFLNGAANAATGLAVNLVISDIYGKENYGEIKSQVTIFSTPAYSLGIAAVGYCFDFTGSYDMILIIYSVLTVVQVVLMNLLYNRKKANLLYN